MGGTHPTRRFVDVVERFAERAEVLPSSSSEFHPAHQSNEQRHPEIGFQQLHLVTHRRGRDMKFLGGLLKREMAARAFEGTNGIERREFAHGATIAEFLSLIR